MVKKERQILLKLFLHLTFRTVIFFELHVAVIILSLARISFIQLNIWNIVIIETHLIIKLNCRILSSIIIEGIFNKFDSNCFQQLPLERVELIWSCIYDWLLTKRDFGCFWLLFFWNFNIWIFVWLFFEVIFYLRHVFHDLFNLPQLNFLLLWL